MTRDEVRKAMDLVDTIEHLEVQVDVLSSQDSQGIVITFHDQPDLGLQLSAKARRDVIGIMVNSLQANIDELKADLESL